MALPSDPAPFVVPALLLLRNISGLKILRWVGLLMAGVTGVGAVVRTYSYPLEVVSTDSISSFSVYFS